jgi:hypothetical protein
VDKGTFKLHLGKPKANPSADALAKGAHEVTNGAIIYRSGGNFISWMKRRTRNRGRLPAVARMRWPPQRVATEVGGPVAALAPQPAA